MTDEFIEDISEERERVAQVLEFMQLREGAERKYTVDDAINLANVSRYYVDPTPDLAAAIAETGISWDDPLLSDIMFDDAAEQENSWWDDHVYNPILKGGIRATGAVVEGLWEEGFSRPMRTGIRAYQDDTDQSLLTSWREAGSSDIAIAVGQRANSKRVNWGTGLTPNSELAHEQPGFGKEVMSQTQGLVADGVAPAEAYRQTFELESDRVYADIGQPITYQGQQARESTLISYGDRVTPFSLGRAAAVRVADPQSMLFNTISGTIDATARIAFDPINVPANEVGLAWKARNAIVPIDNAREAGLIASRRPWVNPKTAEAWFAKGRGQRTVEVLTQADGIYEVNRLVPELPMIAQRRLVAAGSADEVRNILKPYMGTVLEDAPTVGTRRAFGMKAQEILGDNVMKDPNALVLRQQDNKIGQMVRKWTAESGDRMVSAYNIDHALPAFRAQMETAGASIDDMDRVLMQVARAEGDTLALRRAYGEMIEVIGKRFDDLGYNGDDASEIMRMISNEQEKAQMFLSDLAGNPIEVEGADFLEIVMPDGTTAELPINGGHLESEFAEHTIVMPNLRDIRRASSWGREWSYTKQLELKEGIEAVQTWLHPQFEARMGWDPQVRGIKSGRITQGLDAVQSVWRNFALARVGWTFRVIGEEMIRKRAAGYSHMVENPAQALLAAMTDRGMVDLYGDNLDDFFKMKGLGASGFKRDLTNDVMRGTRFDRSRQAWVPIETRKVVSVDPNTGAKTYEWTTKGREGIATEFIQLGNSDVATRLAVMDVDEAMQFYRTAEGQEIIQDIIQRSGGGITSKLDDQVMLRRYIESVDARRHGTTGGDYIYRKNGESTWNLSNGKAWDGDPRNMTGTQIDQQLADMGVTGPKGGKAGRGLSVDERRRMLLDEMGMPHIDDYGDAQFIVIKEGSDEMLDFLASDEIYGEMTKAEIKALENRIPQMFDDGGYIPPAKVKGVSQALDQRLTAWYDDVVDGIFSTIMEKPTMAINRSPFAKTRYTEELARFSVWSDDATRARIVEWADGNGVLDELLEFQKQELRNKGFKTGKLPKVDDPFTSFDEIDRLAKAKAVDDTKALFYDLAQKGNWADAMRFIAPFADAWWEVISRWGQMLAPSSSMGGMGQAIKNWERIRQASQGIQTETNKTNGMFAEDEFGNRVFNVPGAGMLSPSIREGFRKTVPLASMMFVDPSTPRGIMLPGAGPMLQFPAQMVTPMVEKFFGQQWGDSMNSFIFGDFAPGELTTTQQLVDPFLPTWMRRGLDAFLDERNMKVYADEIVGTYSANLINGGDRYGDRTNEESMRTLEAARKTGEQLGYARVADSLFGPLSPQYTPVVYVDMLGHEDGDLMLSMIAIGDELRQAEEIFGDDVMARQFIMERYGFDPLNVTSKTSGIYSRPFSKDGYQYLEDNPDLRHFNKTLMMFIDEGDQPEFYGPAWQDQFGGDDPARIKINPEQGRHIISRQKGQMAYTELTRVYDEAKRQAKGILPAGSNSLRAYMDELDDWKYGQTQDISASYFAWGNDKDIPGGVERPSSQQLYDEVMQINKAGSEARQTAMKHRPELVDFIDKIALAEQSLNAGSRERGNKEDWWRGTPGVTDGEEKRAVQQWYVDKVQKAISEIEDDESRYAARWMQERIFIYMLENSEFVDEAIMFDPMEPPAPTANWIEEVG